MDFIIIEFLDAPFVGDIAIASTLWLCDEDTCYWPPFWKHRSKMKKALKKKETSNPEIWSLHKIRQLKSFRKPQQLLNCIS